MTVRIDSTNYKMARRLRLHQERYIACGYVAVPVMGIQKEAIGTRLRGYFEGSLPLSARWQAARYGHRAAFAVATLLEVRAFGQQLPLVGKWVAVGVGDYGGHGAGLAGLQSHAVGGSFAIDL